jgi:hypothetical protein
MLFFRMQVGLSYLVTKKGLTIYEFNIIYCDSLHG